MGPVEVMSKFRTLASGKVPARGYVPPAVAKAIRNKLAFAVPLMYIKKAQALEGAAGGTIMLLDAVGPLAGVDAVWVAIVVICDAAGGATYRAMRGVEWNLLAAEGIKALELHGSEQAALTAVGIELADPEVALAAAQRNEARRALPSELALQAAANARARDDAPRVAAAAADGGLAFSCFSVEGSLGAATVAQPATPAAPRRNLSQFLSARQSAPEASMLRRRPAGTPVGAGGRPSAPRPSAASPEYVAFGGGAQPPSRAGSLGSEDSLVSAATEAQRVGLMNLGLAKRTAKALVSVGIANEAVLKSNSFEVVIAGVNGFFAEKGRPAATLIESNALSAAMSQKRSPRPPGATRGGHFVARKSASDTIAGSRLAAV